MDHASSSATHEWVPHVAMLGAISSGKSSLISVLFKVPLPSSRGFSMRCVTRLVLSRGPIFAGNVRVDRFQSRRSDHEAAIESLDDVPRVVERLTELLVINDESISNDTIVLTLQGPTLVDFVVVDLPGFVPDAGERHDDAIATRVRDLVHRHTSQPDTILLAVVPATTTADSVETLEKALEVDPEGKRTVMVVTKLDLVDDPREAPCSVAGAERDDAIPDRHVRPARVSSPAARRARPRDGGSARGTDARRPVRHAHGRAARDPIRLALLPSGKAGRGPVVRRRGTAVAARPGLQRARRDAVDALCVAQRDWDDTDPVGRWMDHATIGATSALGPFPHPLPTARTKPSNQRSGAWTPHHPLPRSRHTRCSATCASSSSSGTCRTSPWWARLPAASRRCCRLSRASHFRARASTNRTTRCATRLVLSSGPVFKGTAHVDRFGLCQTDHEAVVESIDDVPRIVERLTQLLVADGAGVSSDTIVLELQGPALPDCVLVDLPGFDSDSGQDRCARDVSDQHTTKPHMILLAVVPATTTSLGATYLRKARDADWNGDRTIGVVTKLECADVLEEGRMEQLLFAKTYRLPLGFHAVHYHEQQLVRFVTRPVGDTRSDEQLFFECHHRWNKLPGSCWGVPKLWDRLVSTHLTLVKTEALAAVEELLAKANGVLLSVCPPMDTPLQRRTMFLSLAESFVHNLSSSLRSDRSLATLAELLKQKFIDVHDQIAGIELAAAPSVGQYVRVHVDGQIKIFRVDGVGDHGSVMCLELKSTWLHASEYTPHGCTRFVTRFPSYETFCALSGRWTDAWGATVDEIVRQYATLAWGAMKHAGSAESLPRAREFFQDRTTAVLRACVVRATARVRAVISPEHLKTTYLRLGQKLCSATDIVGIVPPNPEDPTFPELLETTHLINGLRDHFVARAGQIADAVRGCLDDEFLNDFHELVRGDLLATADSDVDNVVGEVRTRRRELETKIAKLNAVRKLLAMLT